MTSPIASRSGSQAPNTPPKKPAAASAASTPLFTPEKADNIKKIQSIFEEMQTAYKAQSNQQRPEGFVKFMAKINNLSAVFQRGELSVEEMEKALDELISIYNGIFDKKMAADNQMWKSFKTITSHSLDIASASIPVTHGNAAPSVFHGKYNVLLKLYGEYKENPSAMSVVHAGATAAPQQRGVLPPLGEDAALLTSEHRDTPLFSALGALGSASSDGSLGYSSSTSDNPHAAVTFGNAATRLQHGQTTPEVLADTRGVIAAQTAAAATDAVLAEVEQSNLFVPVQDSTAHGFVSQEEDSKQSQPNRQGESESLFNARNAHAAASSAAAAGVFSENESYHGYDAEHDTYMLSSKPKEDQPRLPTQDVSLSKADEKKYNSWIKRLGLGDFIPDSGEHYISLELLRHLKNFVKEADNSKYLSKDEKKWLATDFPSIFMRLVGFEQKVEAVHNHPKPLAIHDIKKVLQLLIDSQIKVLGGSPISHVICALQQSSYKFKFDIGYHDSGDLRGIALKVNAVGVDTPFDIPLYSQQVLSEYYSMCTTKKGCDEFNMLNAEDSNSNGTDVFYSAEIDAKTGIAELSQKCRAMGMNAPIECMFTTETVRMLYESDPASLNKNIKELNDLYNKFKSQLKLLLPEADRGSLVDLICPKDFTLQRGDFPIDRGFYGIPFLTGPKTIEYVYIEDFQNYPLSAKRPKKESFSLRKKPVPLELQSNNGEFYIAHVNGIFENKKEGDNSARKQTLFSFEKGSKEAKEGFIRLFVEYKYSEKK